MDMSFLEFAAIVLGIVWFIFPFVVMARMGEMRDDIKAIRTGMGFEGSKEPPYRIG
jgi:hypothetical protein